MSRKKNELIGIETIGGRIRYLRGSQSLTQQEFAKMLGVSRPYISELEKDKYIPSEQLLLSICRSFNVHRIWVEKGVGEIWDRSQLSLKGHELLDEINRRLISGKRQVPLSVVAKFLGIDVEVFPEDRDRVVEFADGDIVDAADKVIVIFREGDRMKMEAVMALLNALTASKTEQGISQIIKDHKRKSAIEHIEQARKAAELGNFDRMRLMFLNGIRIYEQLNKSGRYDKEIRGAFSEYTKLCDTDPTYSKGIIGKIVSVVAERPGILLKDLYSFLPGIDEGSVELAVRRARIDGRIEMVRKSGSYELAPKKYESL